MEMNTLNGTDNAAVQMHETVDQIAGAIHRTVDKVADVAGQAEVKIRETWPRMVDKEHEIVDGVRDYIVLHPFTSVGIAVATGFIVKALLFSKS